MLGPTLTLAALILTLALAVFNHAGTDSADWNGTLLLVGLISFSYWQLTHRRNRAPAMKTSLQIAIWALPCYLAFQLMPLPAGLVGMLSPARAGLSYALTPVVPGIHAMPLTTDVSATLFGLFTVLGCIAAFLLVRELAWRFSARPWILVVPLVAIAAAEAVLGAYQFLFKNSLHASGTYADYDHFSGLLEMILPMAALLGVAWFRKRKPGKNSARHPEIAATIAWVLAALMLFGIACSLSRTGLPIAFCVLFVVAALTIGFHLSPGTSRSTGLLLAAAMLVVLLAALPSEQLLGRLAVPNPSTSPEKLSIDTRVQIWQQTIPLVGEFPVFGCGLGAYESNFLKFQAVAYAARIRYAYNDYLQVLAELGLAGFGIVVMIIYLVARQIIKGMARLIEPDRRLLVIACGGSLIAVLLHSLVDFNLHVPGNALTLAWVAGLGSINGLD